MLTDALLAWFETGLLLYQVFFNHGRYFVEDESFVSFVRVT